MKHNLYSSLLLFISAALLNSCGNNPLPEIPHLAKNGEAVQLIVDGKPFLILGGELHNSSSSSRDYMSKIWPELEESGMNTVLAAVEWSLVEPEEGKYDFTVVDNLISDAREHNLKLILLWFGSWKNGQTHYAPQWVKTDYKRFPRVKTADGKSLEILSAFGKETLNSDVNAFAAMMRHIKETDEAFRTVIMIQVQNEVGILGSTRDYSDLAKSVFNNNVPPELISYLEKNKENLLPEVRDVWEAAGFKTAGTWEDIFGKTVQAEEFFMAWAYARFLNECTQKGKAEYPLPMFVNAWIVQAADKLPGDYPSGGPQSHVLDIWRAGAPDVDLLCPDIYRPEFAEICALYTRNNNTLFIPESRAGEQGAGQLFYAVGKHKALGYSPFGFESRVTNKDGDPISDAYKFLADFAPVILDAQSKGTITSVLISRDKNPAEEIRLGDYKLLVELIGRNWSPDSPSNGYGIIINSAPGEYLVYGNNIQVSFSPDSPGPAIAAISRVDEGRFSNGSWIPGRRLNGDDIALDLDLAKKAKENKTGTGLKFSGKNRKIQWVRLYRFE